MPTRQRDRPPGLEVPDCGSAIRCPRSGGIPVRNVQCEHGPRCGLVPVSSLPVVVFHTRTLPSASPAATRGCAASAARLSTRSGAWAPGDTLRPEVDEKDLPCLVGPRPSRSTTARPRRGCRATRPNRDGRRHADPRSRRASPRPSADIPTPRGTRPARSRRPVRRDGAKGFHLTGQRRVPACVARCRSGSR